MLYDKQGDAHFDTISAFIKSLRGSDPDAALFWLARMVEAGENPRFIFRRMLIAAGEDIGLADPQAVVVVEACAAAFERVGLPEGLYPLAQAALYLAGAEKSNSVLGFFDALKSVRETNRQQVPSHLRDAHRDGQAFGDGVGYRYPHAYAEHWVAQQYLPSAVQGEIFWQPGTLGWEGKRRERLQQRRAAQLAAAAEMAADQGDILSSSPDDPQLERWLQRQAAAEGERLDTLRRRFWDGVTWQRHDLVLVIEARSLLWALDPMASTPEGGVVITVAEDATLERLKAQLQMLDALRQPQLLVAPPDRPKALAGQLAPESDTRFDWVVARQPWQGLTAQQVEAWIGELGALLGAKGQWRLLFSAPQIGPATGLRALQGEAEGPLQSLLEALTNLEHQQLSQESKPGQQAQKALINHGWRVQTQSWQESLQLELSAALIERWLTPGSAYLEQLAVLRGTPLITAEVEILRAGFRSRLNQPLPQTLEHTLLIARLDSGDREKLP